jgi:hypothetical protein
MARSASSAPPPPPPPPPPGAPHQRLRQDRDARRGLSGGCGLPPRPGLPAARRDWSCKSGILCYKWTSLFPTLWPPRRNQIHVVTHFPKSPCQPPRICARKQSTDRYRTRPP